MWDLLHSSAKKLCYNEIPVKIKLTIKNISLVSPSAECLGVACDVGSRTAHSEHHT